MTPQDRGRDFEKRWAERMGSEPTPGSGNKWYAKQDVADGSVLWSCKSTDAASFSVTKDLMREVVQAINGQGGVGGGVIPGIALDVSGDEFVVLRAEDYIRMVTEQVAYLRPSPGEAKRQRGSVPSLLRDSE